MSSTDFGSYRADARPGLAPGSTGEPPGTLFAALYGEPARRPEAGSEDTEDAYSLFYQRSVAMGWLAEVGPAGFWGMNDAGQEHPDAAPAPFTWFQVGLERVPPGMPLPVQPFLCCAGEVAARLGVARPDTVQLLLPVQSLAASARAKAPSSLLHTAGWFAGRSPRTRIRATLDSGRAPTVPAAAPAMHTWMRSLEQEVVTWDSYPSTGHEPLAATVPFHDAFWNGPPGNRVTFEGTVAEWSPDALGWVAALLAEGAARNGVTTPVVLTAGRAA
ncbi:hypothetical protein [Amycolatopsis cihanbeyliensis]|uniref:Uncharacterized protein n=1 Tax=Amycolatopsis cihanbeyliensis TaxID=1128664 RepID=A0A542DQ06_AMYCI|nr:hypothetical protein [Amycolatopsis cihanbeyliensis]TQJ05190.1 hypothetical protein FB471_5016 [Amycolatopsis cihanbeyliensis]